VICTRCDRYTNRLLSGADYHHCCHSNLARALAAERGMPLAEAEHYVHEVLSVFMCTGFTRDTHQYFMKASPLRPGDFLEFVAEVDLLGALSRLPRRRLRLDAFERHGEVLPAKGGGVSAGGGEFGWVAQGGKERI
jgi:uncharacterized protein YcgI (DUF1989 family)